MATKKISELNELISPVETDTIPIINTGETKKIKLSNLKSVLGIAQAEADIDAIETAIETATQLEAEAGTDNAKKMTPLGTKQAIITNIAPNTTAINSGWNTFLTTLVLLTADAPVYKLTTETDQTGNVGLGDKFKFTHGGEVKYGIVVAITSSTITLYCGTDYTISDTAITSIFYSHAKSPLGFPMSPAKWSVISKLVVGYSKVSPTQNVWYNAHSIVVPIGLWDISYSGLITAITVANKTSARVGTTLSEANNTESDGDFSTYGGVSGASSTITFVNYINVKKEGIPVTTKKTLYLNIRTVSAPGDIANIDVPASIVPTIITAVCSYL